MKTYVICGLSGRAIGHFALPLIGNPKLPEYGDYSAHGRLVAILDIDRERVEIFNRNQGCAVPYYSADAFDRMIAETNPDVVVVTSPDVHHAAYIIAALRHNRDVISEKPMVIDGRQARAVLEAERASHGRVRVAHNYRYPPSHQAIKRMIRDGLLGRIVQAQMIYLLNTSHGSSYFRRWNRDRAVSGGLTVTKSCHHFDLLNWWLDDVPEEVFAFGARNYFGADSPFAPSPRDGRDHSVAEQNEGCPYYRRWKAKGADLPKDDHLRAYEAAFSIPMKTQYPRELGIYDKEIAIEDTYSATIRYRSGASVIYSLNASSPWEGYILGIHGTHGRLETTFRAGASCIGDERPEIVYYPMFGERQAHTVPHVEGGHGGADAVMKHDMFVAPDRESDVLRIAAGARDGALAVAVGEAVWRSVAEDKPMRIADLLGGDI
ncbi:MAG: Gfo/Idh/MocA family oxidoreductase [Kiritimatiellae bacterium]|nr:Gfo/Idh/MocA family oxidoreductase [Kiritimatiellia bacterium]